MLGPGGSHGVEVTRRRAPEEATVDGESVGGRTTPSPCQSVESDTHGFAHGVGHCRWRGGGSSSHGSRIAERALSICRVMGLYELYASVIQVGKSSTTGRMLDGKSVSAGDGLIIHGPMAFRRTSKTSLISVIFESRLGQFLRHSLANLCSGTSIVLPTSRL